MCYEIKKKVVHGYLKHINLKIQEMQGAYIIYFLELKEKFR